LYLNYLSAVVRGVQDCTGRIGWLRAAVLGANDGIVSTSSLVLGVAASRATRSKILVAGVAGLVAAAYVLRLGGRWR
jgi:VIT1/CCC1 family predicted Fe2+/Mn2+ transporter